MKVKLKNTRMLKLGMANQDTKFSMVLPAELQKAENGEWRVWGLASTASRDQQGEKVDLNGLDLTPIQKGKGLLNWDHGKDPEDKVGIIDSYKKADDGLYVGGYLFNNHTRAKSIYEIMSSLKKADRGRMGMSIEGVIKERAGNDGKIIKKAVITAVALTMNPVNSDTHVDLVKSLTGSDVEFEGDTITSQSLDAIPEVEKSLGVTGSYATSVPSDLSGGDALAMEGMDKKPKKEDEEEEHKPKKKLKKMSKEMIKSNVAEILSKLQVLYPESTRSELWETVKQRLNTRFLENQETEKN
jgi:hypothetical protein